MISVVKAVPLASFWTAPAISRAPTLWGFGSGNVFKLTRSGDGTWTYASLYTITGGDDGASPTATPSSWASN